MYRAVWAWFREFTSEMDVGPICWTQPDPAGFLNDPTESKQAEQLQCNIIEQFYVSNISPGHMEIVDAYQFLSRTDIY